VIPGLFDPALPSWPRPLIRVMLYLPGISKNWAPVYFLLDTGAGTSVVHPLDATTKLGINDAALRNPALWPIQRTAHGVGGLSPEYSVPAHYALQRDDGTWAKHQEDLAIAQPMQGNQTLPSLLGWDILRHYRIVADWHARSIRLEDP
jgi:hypothetical protein